MYRIKSLSFTEVVVPAQSGVIESKGINKALHMIDSKGEAAWTRQFDQISKYILKLELDDGTIGFGEFYRDADPEVVNKIARNLLGQNIKELALQALPIPPCREYDGFECAILDLYAKIHKLKVVDLLGGPVRLKAKITSWSSHRSNDEVAKVAEKYYTKGYDCIKFKCDLEDDVVHWAKEIKRVAPKMDVIFDPNQRWVNFGECKKLLKSLEDVGNIFCVEDPLPHWMLQEYHDLRMMTNIRIVRHISLPYVTSGQRMHDLINVLMHRSADGFNINGSSAGFRDMDAIIHASNMYTWHGSEVDLGILEALYVHQACAARSCVWPSDIFGTEIRESDLLINPLEIEVPYVHLPEGQGLGVELDQKQLDKYKINEWTVM